MNYKRIYDNLIDSAKNRLLEGYVEKHHIVPKCLGGDNSTNNLVILTPEEHFLAHVLLVKIYPQEPNLILAVQKMTRPVGGRKKRKLYGWLKRLHVERIRQLQSGIGNSQFGSIWITDGKSDKKIKDDIIPEGWRKGRKHKKDKKCQICGEVVDGKKKYCDNHRPTTKSKPYKTRFASDDDIKLALINCNLNIDKAMKSLGYKTTGGNVRYKFIRALAGIV